MIPKTILIAVIFNVASLFSQWTTELVHPPGHVLEYVNIVDSSVAWAIGHYGTNQDSSMLLIRTDKSSWFQHYLQIANNNDFTCVAALDKDRVWIGTGDGKVYYHSYNNNKTILQLDIGGEAYINDIKFSRLNRSYGYIYCDPPGGAGTPFKIYKTSNSGVNWIELSPIFGGSYLGSYASMCVTDSNHVWLGLNCQNTGCQIPKVAYSTDGGLSWQVSSIPNGSNYVSAVVFKTDNQYGIVAPWDQIPTYLYKSNNGGSTWSFLYNTQLQVPVNSLCWALGTNTWYFSSNDESEQIKKSTNDGLTWNAMTLPNGTDQIMSMDVIRQGNSIYGQAVTLNGRILRLVDSVSVIGIQNIGTEVPQNFILYQNYPNPFNPVTKIRFGIPAQQDYSQSVLKIYNALGREISTLVKEPLKAGTYEVEWDASNLPSGIYFCRLYAGNSIFTNKMVLTR
jgi:photosystem II stability/assembly factor-like uncharacterized protein